MRTLFLVTCLIGIHGCTDKLSPGGESDLLGSWWIKSIGDRPVVNMSTVEIEFVEGNRVAGNAGCNHFMGGYTLSEENMTITRLGSTRMVCPPALMEQETRLFATLQQVVQVRLGRGSLELLDHDGNPLVSASKAGDAR